MAETHKRRPHYSGRYPKKFEEKYKEQQPDKYQDLIEHVISKGNTPAGMHLPIMADEILDFLKIRPGMNGLDCTLGYGGHTSRMLELLKGEGHLTSLDADPVEIIKTTERLRAAGFGEDVFTSVRINFRHLDEVAQKYGPFDFLLADLGVSSMQIDNPERGFSFRSDGPLDMRMDPSSGETAAQRLKSLSKDEIAWMLQENSDEPYAEEIARAITQYYKKGGLLNTTSELRNVVEQAVGRIPANRLQEEDRASAVRKACARTFQALRIDVNSEMEVLYEFLEKLPDALKPGGHAAILTFHSGEDRLVKKAFQACSRSGIFSYVSPDPLRPTKDECFRNPRARSAKLRCAVKQ